MTGASVSAPPLGNQPATAAFETSADSADDAVSRHWRACMAALRAHLAHTGAAANRCLVLVPYAQLMAQARAEWRHAVGAEGGPVPRFETTRNWAEQLAPFEPDATDFSHDPARNRVLAAQWLWRSGGRQTPEATREALVDALLEVVQQLAPLAAAVPPEERAAWAEATSATVDAHAVPAASLELLVQRVAVAWLSHSAFATDVLWQHALPGQGLQALVVLEGFQPDPLAQRLLRAWGARGLCLSLFDAQAPRLPPVLHPCADPHDEAQRAAACVIQAINQGQVPVALVAQDRVLTRRIHAHLQGAGLPIRDETGWRLSTSHAAACLMAILRAGAPHARTDEVLDALKHLPLWPVSQVNALERRWRQAEVSQWTQVCGRDSLRTEPVVAIEALLGRLRAARPLRQWLIDVAQVLHDGGVWPALAADRAGAALLRCLWLDTPSDEAAPEWLSQATRPWPLSTFTRWVRDVLEAANFVPLSPEHAPVIVLPMAQMLGRRFGAVVAPGCDEQHCPRAPEPQGWWSTAQRAALGLPSRDDLARAAGQAWQHLLSAPHTHLLWREQDDQQPVLPTPWLRADAPALPSVAAAAGHDPRCLRTEPAQPLLPPAASAPDLLPSSLSASAYSDLRTCPYRFFALRQLRLGELAELDQAPDKRDLGNWLHRVLRRFHEQRPEPRQSHDDRSCLDALSTTVADEMGLGASDFLPFRAAWPAWRDGYLAWLHSYEERPDRPGPRFVEAEATREVALGPWRLKGQLDRIDQQRAPDGLWSVVIDYKTESLDRLKARVRTPLEDTQLAFYAALQGGDTLRAAYLHLGEGQGGVSTWVEQPELLAARDALLTGLADDLQRIAEGQPLRALGEGQACDFCAARGLCRKDFWS